MLSEKFIFTPLKEKYVRCDSCIPSWLRSSRSFRYSFTAELFAPTEFSLIFFISFITLVSAHRHFAKSMDKMRVCVCEFELGFLFSQRHTHTHTHVPHRLVNVYLGAIEEKQNVELECAVSVLLYQLSHLSNGILYGKRGHAVKWIERSSNCRKIGGIFVDGNHSGIDTATTGNKVK